MTFQKRENHHAHLTTFVVDENENDRNGKLVIVEYLKESVTVAPK